MRQEKDNPVERCAICGCALHRDGDYGKPNVKGRSHATKHHFVAERFFGRSGNRSGEKREGIFDECPWNLEQKHRVFCYECHEELLHNPVFLPVDIHDFSKLVRDRHLDEESKPSTRERIAGRIMLLQEVVHAGLQALSERNQKL